jgi:membrane protease YdiL (CAAX protease family)
MQEGLGSLASSSEFPSELQAPAVPAPRPPALGRWLLAVTLFSTYLPLQIVAAIPPVIVALMSYGPLNTEADLTRALERFIDSEEALWITIGSASVAAVVTIVVAWAWPWIWRLFVPATHFSLADWLGWNKPRWIKTWMVPLITLPFLLVVVIGVSLTSGPTEVDVQMQLFSTTGLQIVSGLVVSTIVPLAEELVFRGALYNALLRSPREGEPRWRRHVVPFVVVSLLFGGAHLLAGFATFAAIVQIVILSTYLTALRAVSGSVRPSLIAHMVWNMAGAVALILVNTVPGLKM